jgi:hypothetical protein
MLWLALLLALSDASPGNRSLPGLMAWHGA